MNFKIIFFLQITKDQVDHFVPGSQVPSCQLYVEWTRQQEQPVQLMYRVKLLGAKEPNNFFLIRIPAPQGEDVTVRNFADLLALTLGLVWLMCMYVSLPSSPGSCTANTHSIRKEFYSTK